MEKVECIDCGSIGWTASPERVPCSECGGRHRTIPEEYENIKLIKKFGILSLTRLARG